MRAQISKHRKISGYLTVYLTLVMAVLLSLCLTLIEGARGSAVRLEAEIVTATATDSVLAEYHRELMKQYNLFAIDSSYGTAGASSASTARRLKTYLDKNFETEEIFLSGWLYRDFLGMSAEKASLQKVRYLTDDGGAVFRRRAAEAMQDDIGITLLQQVVEWVGVVEGNSLETTDVAGMMENAEREIESNRRRVTETVRVPKEKDSTGEGNGSDEKNGDLTEDSGKNPQETEDEEVEYEEVEVDRTPSYSSPVSKIEQNARKGILTVVLDDPEQLSTRGIHSEVLVYQRMRDGNVNTGNLELTDTALWEDMTERLFFDEYLLRYLGHYGSTSENDVLLYQAEYLITGKDSDVENLRGVANRLLTLRTAADFLYIQGDEAKTAEAEAIGTVLALAVLTPELADTFKELILLGWSYMEGIYDVRSLLAGGKIPLMKSKETWHYSLTGALTGWTDSAEKGESGLSYTDYLRIFLFLTGKEKLTGRAMNLVEADIRLTAGNSAFRLDACIDAFEAEIIISSAYGYRYTLTREKEYE